MTTTYETNPGERRAIGRAAVFRAAAGLSQHELADITGWSQSSLSLFESAHRDTLYDVRALLRFADAVDMPREALLPLVLGHPGAALPDTWLAEMSVAAGTVLEKAGLDVDRRSATSRCTARPRTRTGARLWPWPAQDRLRPLAAAVRRADPVANNQRFCVLRAGR